MTIKKQGQKGQKRTDFGEEFKRRLEARRKEREGKTSPAIPKAEPPMSTPDQEASRDICKYPDDSDREEIWAAKLEAGVHEIKLFCLDRTSIGHGLEIKPHTFEKRTIFWVFKEGENEPINTGRLRGTDLKNPYLSVRKTERNSKVGWIPYGNGMFSRFSLVISGQDESYCAYLKDAAVPLTGEGRHTTEGIIKLRRRERFEAQEAGRPIGGRWSEMLVNILDHEIKGPRPAWLEGAKTVEIPLDRHVEITDDVEINAALKYTYEGIVVEVPFFGIRGGGLLQISDENSAYFRITPEMVKEGRAVLIEIPSQKMEGKKIGPLTTVISWDAGGINFRAYVKDLPEKADT